MNGITVAELIELLEGLEPDDLVYIAQPTHDHWHNVKAVAVTSCDYAPVRYSQYHESLVLDEDERDNWQVVIQ